MTKDPDTAALDEASDAFLHGLPGASVQGVADATGVPRLDLERWLLERARAEQTLPTLLRHTIARALQSTAASAFDWRSAGLQTRLSLHLRLYLARVAASIDAPRAWVPMGADDPRLVAAFHRAGEVNSLRDQFLLERGSPFAQSGDIGLEFIERARQGLDLRGESNGVVAQLYRLPAPIQHILCTHHCYVSTQMGGLWSFFHNPAGTVGPEARAGFAALGLLQSADLLGAAMSRLGEPYPRDTLVRRKLAPDEDFFAPIDEDFSDAVDVECGGFRAASDAYVARLEANA